MAELDKISINELRALGQSQLIGLWGYTLNPDDAAYHSNSLLQQIIREFVRRGEPAGPGMFGECPSGEPGEIGFAGRSEMTQTSVKERGMSFTSWSIPKVLDGTKTQTRRTWGLEFVNQDPDAFEFVEMKGNLAIFKGPYKYVSSPIPKRLLPKLMVGRGSDVLFYINCPYGQVGDRLWVKEVWTPDPFHPDETLYKANTNEYIEGVLKSQLVKWKSPRFMPRRASRKDLEITEVRAERLQNITEADAEAEGCSIRAGVTVLGNMGLASARHEFKEIWDPLNPRYPWAGNWWVWPIGFKLT